MKISRIDHLGIGVKSIEEALPFFENVLGLKCYAVEEVADQKVKTAFLKVGEVKLELLEPTSPESAVAKWLENGGKGVHHVAFAVEDGVQEALLECESKEIRLIDKGVHHVAFAVEDGVQEALLECESKEIRLIDKAPRLGAENMMIGFLHPKFTAGVLTELCEPKK